MIAGAGVGVVAATTGSAAQQGPATQTEVVTEYVIEAEEYEEHEDDDDY